MANVIKLEQLELVEVNVEDAKATLTFLDAAAGEIREVSFNKKVFDKDTQKFVANAEKAEEVEKWCQEYLNTSFDEIQSAVGQLHDVYVYPKFNSLWETNYVELAKFDEDMVGQVLSGEIVDVKVEDEGIRIFLKYEDEVYRSNMSFTKQIGGTYYGDPNKKAKQIAKFEDKFQVTLGSALDIVGKTVMFEVKKFAGNGSIYIDIKPFPKAKGKGKK